MATVLVVEDLAEMRMLLVATLKVAGHTVVEAADGRDVMRLALEAAPAAVLMDVLMRDVDGWEALKRLKSDERTKRIPVIMVSALSSDGDLGQARNLGAFDYVTKPWSAGELTERVRWAIVSSKAA